MWGFFIGKQINWWSCNVNDDIADYELRIIVWEREILPVDFIADEQKEKFMFKNAKTLLGR